MIPVATGVRIWIATGHTDMRKGMQGLALLVQEGLGRDPFAGDVFVFRGRAGSLIKALWHDSIGLSLYAKRLDRGRFVWPATVDGVVALASCAGLHGCGRDCNGRHIVRRRRRGYPASLRNHWSGA
jgi:transposase